MNATWVLVGQGLRLAIQGTYFVMIARALGPSEYGAFVGVVSAVAILAPFVGLGSANVLIKNVAVDASLFREYFGNALLLTAASGAASLLVVLSLCKFA